MFRKDNALLKTGDHCDLTQVNISILTLLFTKCGPTQNVFFQKLLSKTMVLAQPLRVMIDGRIKETAYRCIREMINESSNQELDARITTALMGITPDNQNTLSPYAKSIAEALYDGSTNDRATLLLDYLGSVLGR